MDTIIESHLCYISSHVVISGNVHLKNQIVFIGVNASIRDSITIEKESLIGAGAVIMGDTAPKGVYVPEKAKLLNKRSDEIIISPKDLNEKIKSKSYGTISTPLNGNNQNYHIEEIYLTKVLPF